MNTQFDLNSWTSNWYAFRSDGISDEYDEHLNMRSMHTTNTDQMVKKNRTEHTRFVIYDDANSAL